MDFKLTIQDRTKVFSDDPRVVGDAGNGNSGGDKGEGTQVKFGISIRPASDEEKDLTPEKRGVAVTRVESGSFAEDIGMMEKDIIIGINRQTISSVEDIRKAQQGLRAGDPVAFRIVRPNPLAQGRGRAQGNVPKAATLFLSGTLPE